MHRLPTFTHRCVTRSNHSNLQSFLIPGTTRKWGYGLSSWTSINFRHPNHKTGNLFVRMQNGTCRCYHPRGLGKSPRIPLSRCPAIPGYADRLGFLTERIWTLRQWIMHPTNFPGLCIHRLSFSLNPKVSGRTRNPPLFILTYQRTFNNTKITKKSGISKYLCNFFQTFFAPIVRVELT